MRYLNYIIITALLFYACSKGSNKSDSEKYDSIKSVNHENIKITDSEDSIIIDTNIIKEFSFQDFSIKVFTDTLDIDNIFIFDTDTIKIIDLKPPSSNIVKHHFIVDTLNILLKGGFKNWYYDNDVLYFSTWGKEYHYIYSYHINDLQLDLLGKISNDSIDFEINISSKGIYYLIEEHPDIYFMDYSGTKSKLNTPLFDRSKYYSYANVFTVQNNKKYLIEFGDWAGGFANTKKVTFNLLTKEIKDVSDQFNRFSKYHSLFYLYQSSDDDLSFLYTPDGVGSFKHQDAYLISSNFDILDRILYKQSKGYSIKGFEVHNKSITSYIFIDHLVDDKTTIIFDFVNPTFEQAMYSTIRNQIVDKNQIKNLNRTEKYVVANSIFSKYGYSFSDYSKIGEYFGLYYYYDSVPKVDSILWDRLNSNDYKNLQIILNDL